jgi:hypothetical protein
VIEGPIQFYALCEHHALPFFGHAYVGYIAPRWVTSCRWPISCSRCAGRRARAPTRGGPRALSGRPPRRRRSTTSMSTRRDGRSVLLLSRRGGCHRQERGGCSTPRATFRPEASRSCSPLITAYAVHRSR